MYWTLELASSLDDAPWPASKEELIDYANRSGAPEEVIENLTELEDDGEVYEPISVWIKDKGRPEIICRCQFCGALKTELIDHDDNPITIMSVATKPLANPPFPIERLQELTDLMGGQGDMNGYYRN